MKDQSGLSLIELLVAISLLGVLMLIVSNLYVTSLKTVSVSRGLTYNTKTVSTAMNAVTRVIRAGTANPKSASVIADPAFVLATRDNLVMYAYVNLDSAAEKPVMIQLRVDRTTGKIVERRWAAIGPVDGYWTFPNYLTATPISTRTLGEVVSPTNLNVFTFTSDTNTKFAPSATNLSADERRSIRSVDVELTIQSTLTDSKNKVTLKNTVGIPNLGFTGGEI